jgi:hypothetical protein
LVTSPVILALALALSAAATDAALATRVSRFFNDIVLTDDDEAAHKTAVADVQKLFAQRGPLTVAQAGDEGSYTFAMLACETSALEARTPLLEKLRAAVAKHELPADALTYCETRTKQNRVRAAAARGGPANAALRDDITHLYSRDQSVRLGTRADARAWAKTDRELHAPLERIFAQHGVPTYDLVGPEAASQFALMIQHQPPEFRRKVLPKLKANVDVGQGDATVYAMMYDRAATDEGRPQRYGENFVCDDRHPDMHPAPIEDEAHVNERRAAVGKIRLELQTRLIAAMYRSSPCGGH